jgi:hypothetical protein
MAENEVLSALKEAVRFHRGRVLDSEFFQSGDTTVFQVEFITNSVTHQLEFRSSQDTGNLLRIKNVRTDEVIVEQTVSDDPNDIEGEASKLLGQVTLESKAQAILEGDDPRVVMELKDLSAALREAIEFLSGVRVEGTVSLRPQKESTTYKIVTDDGMERNVAIERKEGERGRGYFLQVFTEVEMDEAILSDPHDPEKIARKLSEMLDQ